MLCVKYVICVFDGTYPGYIIRQYIILCVFYRLSGIYTVVLYVVCVLQNMSCVYTVVQYLLILIVHYAVCQLCCWCVSDNIS